ncbi:hypothetical protein MAPG_06408 [Magnaporthiopsis poae ATCC 64411]|uniref:Uncharacterized protein n=1 Tax=Magnaporthiopsis poae (strain ATCC 64411 / 73-15) TaxID=644358 RepID=A0A0C4E1Y3_MAGP6|nr:hypothetical protein MAPG_06408 [Magnaporthiopsis poae ATCC 64411]
MLSQVPRGAGHGSPSSTPQPQATAPTASPVAAAAAVIQAPHRRQVSHFSRPDPRCYQAFLANGSNAPRQSKITPDPVGDVDAIAFGHTTPLAIATTTGEPYPHYHYPSYHQPVHEYSSSGAWSNRSSSSSVYSPTFGQPFVDPVVPSRSRHQSIPSLLPLAVANRAASPQRRHRPALSEAAMPLTGDGRSRHGPISDAPRKGALASWFSPAASDANRGSGEIPTITTPNEEPTTPFARTGSSTSIESQRQRGSSPSPSASRFGFFSAISSALTTQNSSPAGSPDRNATSDKDDDILAMDVEAALFPGGFPVTGEAFSPSAFKNLQMNATAVARRLQGAYRKRTDEARDLAAEMEAQREELEEATTRSTHLKMQLEDMAAKAAEQEQAMRSLLDELAAERRKTAKLLQGQRGDGLLHVPATSEGSISEDLGVDAAEEDQKRRRRLQRQWRGSGGTVTSFDTDDDESVAESESIFSSRCRSPTSAATTDGASPGGVLSPIAASQPPTVLSPPPPHHNKRVPAGSKLPPQPPSRPSQQQQQPQMTTFQRLVKGVTSGPASGQSTDNSPVSSCSNCQGLDASVAWDTVSLLKDENHALKERMNELEDAVEGALDLVNGIGL